MFVLVPSGRGWSGSVLQGGCPRETHWACFWWRQRPARGDLRAALTATVCRQWEKKGSITGSGQNRYWTRHFFLREKRSKHLKHFEDANKENRRLRNQCNVVRWRHKGLREKWESRKVRPESREEHAELNIEVEVAWKVITTAGKKRKKFLNALNAR